MHQSSEFFNLLSISKKDKTRGLTVEDLIDCQIIAVAAIKQCQSQGYASMDFCTACGFADCLQDSFTNIVETDEICEKTLTVSEWLGFLQEVTEYLKPLFS